MEEKAHWRFEYWTGVPAWLYADKNKLKFGKADTVFVVELLPIELPFLNTLKDVVDVLVELKNPKEFDVAAEIRLWLNVPSPKPQNPAFKIKN